MAGAAHAAPTGSTITSPADPARVLWDPGASPGTVVFSVNGTTTGAGNVDMRCFTHSGASNLLASNVPVAANAFHADITSGSIGSPDPCVLRAVPAGDATPRPPGSSDPYQGPRLLLAARA